MKNRSRYRRINGTCPCDPFTLKKGEIISGGTTIIEVVTIVAERLLLSIDDKDGRMDTSSVRAPVLIILGDKGESCMRVGGIMLISLIQDERQITYPFLFHDFKKQRRHGIGGELAHTTEAIHLLANLPISSCVAHIQQFATPQFVSFLNKCLQKQPMGH